ncbi:MAG: cob(I)yrinic acid a,c-diamide adenosyltransferase [Robiginitomaculum sp.]|nr:cob(I)yrinic acid a,c-diamide adenosyltransferase [Robiginitomaculum sp.]
MVRLNKIYTRTGDAGQTHLSDGSRTSKTDCRVVAFGAVDELNSAIGLAVREVKSKQLLTDLARIQNELFDLGADLSHPGPDEQAKTTPLRVVSEQVEQLESSIDQMNESLEPLKSFILPGGSEAAARLHLARAICRRAEIDALLLAETQSSNKAALVYLNRLSDFLFVAARFENKQENTEVLWVPGASRQTAG